MADRKFGAKQGGGGVKHDVFDVPLTKMVDEEIRKQTAKKEAELERMIGKTPTWYDLLNKTERRASIPRDLTYDKAHAAIASFEKRRGEDLFMWPGCDKCRILYPDVIPDPEPMAAGDAVLSAPSLEDRTCLHAAQIDQPLRFHIPWSDIVLIKAELIDAYNSKVDQVKLVRKPGTKRIR